MRALVCSELGPPSKLAVVTVDDPEPSAGQVVVDVAAAGLNFPDTLIIEVISRSGNESLRSRRTGRSPRSGSFPPPG